MKAKYSFVTLILLIMYIFFSFMEGVWVRRFWSEVNYGEHRLTNTISYTAYYRLIPSVFILLFVILAIIVMTLRIVNRKNYLTQKGVFIPAIAFLLFIAMTIFNGTEIIDSGIFGFTEYGVGWAFYACLISLFFSAAMGVMMGLGNIDEFVSEIAQSEKSETNPSVAIISANTAISTNHNTIDELKKYKDLLDTGVITQDEFDAKKKQLLGI